MMSDLSNEEIPGYNKQECDKRLHEKKNKLGFKLKMTRLRMSG